jgi:malonyl-CoA/methylmalonyl-CoA synthetase
MPKFDAPGIWKRWQSPSQDLTLFMAVPTIYSRLIEIYNGMTEEEQKKATASCQQFRLQVSGSAPLPSPLKEKWKQISGGQILLERYGMTETGMIISCGMKEHERVDGHVGLPMPGVSVRLWDDETKKDVTEELEAAGEVQIKGDLVFREYWRLPDKTKEVSGLTPGIRLHSTSCLDVDQELSADMRNSTLINASVHCQQEFTEDGWFKSGDIGIRTKETGFYRIQGRSSVDIIKSGGEKVSAIEVERALLSLDFIKDAVVVGVEDPRWGEVVGCVVVLRDPQRGLELKELRDILRNEVCILVSWPTFAKQS